MPRITPNLERRIGLIQNDVARAQLNLLELSVVSGRSSFAWLRDGFLEFQERLFEELLAGLAWINGKPVMEHLYDHSFGNKHPNRALAPKVDWSVHRHRQLTLSPLELYTSHAESGEHLLKIKAGKFALAFFIPLAAVSLVIPALNQLKTRWMLHHFPDLKNEIRSASRPPARPQTAPLPRRVESGLSPFTGPVTPNFTAPGSRNVFSNPAVSSWALSSGAFSAAGFSPGVVMPQPLMPIPSGMRAYRPTFGHSPLTHGLANLGNLYSNVPYGDLLATDVGMFAGRAYVANQRSRFEAIEGLFRDISSDYFYLWSLPHVMAGLGLGLGALSGVEARHDPVVARSLLVTGQRQLLSRPSADASPLKTLEHLEHVLMGTPRSALSRSDRATLSRQMTSIPHNASLPDSFLPLLQEELAAHGLTRNRGKRLLAYARPYLVNDRMNKAGAQAILNHLNTKGSSSKASSIEQEDTRRAFKWAIEGAHGATDSLNHLPKDVQSRLKTVYERNGLAKAHTGFRRVLGLVSDQSLGAALPRVLLDEAEAYADWLDQTAMRGLSLKEAVTERVGDLIRDVKATSVFDRFEQIEAALQTASRQKIVPAHLSLDDLSLHSAFSPIAKLIHALESAPQNATLAQVDELTSTLQHQRFARLKPIADSAKQLLKLVSPDRTLTDLPHTLMEKLTLPNEGLPQGAPLWEAIHLKLSNVLDQVHSALPEAHPQTPLIKRYLNALPSLLTEGSSNFLNLPPETLAQNLKWVEHGGLVNDPAVGRLALLLRHKLPDSHRAFLPSKRPLQELDALKRYSQTLLKQMAQRLQDPGAQFGKSLWQSFERNRAFQYVNYATALGGSMLGLGVLVPKLQIALNQELTGRSDHPGLAAMVNQA